MYLYFIFEEFVNVEKYNYSLKIYSILYFYYFGIKSVIDSKKIGCWLSEEDRVFVFFIILHF